MYILTLPGERAKLSIKIFHAENDITCTSVDVSLNPWNQKKNCCRNELSLKLWKNKNNYEINNFNKIFYCAIMSSVKHWQGSYSFNLFKFHHFLWLFHDLIKFSITRGLAVTFKTFLALAYFLTFNSSKDTNSGVHQKACGSHFSLSYIVLALSSTVTNLPNKTLIFDDFQWPWLSRFPLPVRLWLFQRI